MKYRAIVLSIALLSGCASNSGIVPISSDAFMISKQQSTGFPGLGNLKAEVITEARSFCLSKGKDIQIINSVETQPPYILGNYPRTEIQFKCMSDNQKH